MTPVLCLLLAALAQGGDDASAWLRRAQEHYQKQEWKAADEAARRALALDQGLADAEVLLGWIDTSQSDLQGAETHFARAVKLRPRDPRALGYLASTRLRLNRVDEAAAGFEQVLRLDPGNVAAEHNLGLIGLMRSRPEQALARFRAVLKIRPSDVAALTGALESELLIDRREEARKSAAAIESLLNAEDPRLFQTATLLALHGENDAAIRILLRMRKAMPGSYDVSYNLALAYFRAAQYEPAAECLRPFLEPRAKAEPWNLLGAIEEKRGRSAEALAAYREAARLEPANEDYRFDVAAQALRHEGVEAAVTAFSQGVRDFPKSWRMRLGLGSVRYLAGDYEDAARVLLEAVALNPEPDAGYFLLGKAYETAPASQPPILAALRAYAAGHRDAWTEYHLGSILLARTQAGASSDLGEAKAHLRTRPGAQA